eukprot:c576_g1_i1.p2 GENE.c576_g1_i1~~c576_g1_i1.p2  ORF type:complete len:236 (+),score=43.15 c576_g1_i1:54-710(+)
MYGALAPNGLDVLSTMQVGRPQITRMRYQRSAPPIMGSVYSLRPESNRKLHGSCNMMLQFESQAAGAAAEGQSFEGTVTVGWRSPTLHRLRFISAPFRTRLMRTMIPNTLRGRSYVPVVREDGKTREFAPRAEDMTIMEDADADAPVGDCTGTNMLWVVTIDSELFRDVTLVSLGSVIIETAPEFAPSIYTCSVGDSGPSGALSGSASTTTAAAASAR